MAEVRRTRLAWVALVLILGIAAFFRLQGFRWDAACLSEDRSLDATCVETHQHPDERFLTMVSTALELPETWSEYLDTSSSPANPRNRGFDFFPYGVAPLLVTRAVAEGLDLTSYDRIHLVGRAISAACSLTTVFLVFLLGRRLYDTTIALVAALLLALAVLPIQQAHFFTVDAMATTASTLALLAAVSIAERGRWRDYLWFGVVLGVAVAVKMSVVTLAVLAVAAAFGRAWQRHAGESSARAVQEPVTAGLAMAAVVSLVAFRLLQPYAFAGPGLLDVRFDPDWLANMREVQELMGGWRDFPPGHQWTDRTPLWFPWKNMVLFGLGPALGLAAWTGWALAGWRAWRGIDRRAVLPWLWVGLLFLHQGTQWVKSMRYLLPIYPPLALFAAWLLVAAWRWAGRRPGLRPRLLAAGLAVTVLGGTLAWAWAFSAIYRRPHSRVEASRWIYANVPEGSAVTHENWDDALPLPLDGRPGMGQFQGLVMHPYAEDTPEKLEEMLDVLDRADYVVLSSNRLYDSIPRLPMRYPMTVRYYDALFEGQLGYERVAEFTSYPTLFGLEIPDQSAEEAFSVYDHPRVQIFARTDEWNRIRARSLLDPGDWAGVLALTPREAARYRSLQLPPKLRDLQTQGGTWLEGPDGSTAGLFPRDRRPGTALVLWILALQGLGLGAFLLFQPALRGLPDRGWMLGKTIGLLVFAFAAWLLASLRLLTFTPTSLRALFFPFAVAAAVVGWRRRRSIARLLGRRWRLLAAEELIFWLLFALLLGVRWLNPDLWHPFRGGEKPMDLAYLNAVVRSSFFPPFDPWFAGGWLNYYYFGFVLTATLTLLTRVPTELAYNLAVPTFFALTAAGAISTVSTLARSRFGSLGPDRSGSLATRRAGAGLPAWQSLRHSRALAWGAAGATILLLVGNLGTLRLWLGALARLSDIDFPSRIPLLPETVRAAHGFLRLLSGARLPIEEHQWYWDASRVIPHPPSEPAPITEFPLFTFLFADLHAHLMALPVAVLVLALLSGWLRRCSVAPRARGSLRGEEATVLGLLAVATGSLAAINTWDLPTYLALTGCGLLVVESTRRPLSAALVSTAWRFLLVLGLGRLAFWPFHRYFVPGYGRVVPWQGSQTTLTAFLVVHALFLLPILIWLLVERDLHHRIKAGARAWVSLLRHRRRARPWLHRVRRLRRALPVRWDRIAEGWGWALAALLLLFGRPLEALLLAVAAPALGLVLAPESRASRRWVACWVLVGCGLALAVEHLVLAGDIGRMNTVFKSYLQIWTLWALAAGVALALSSLRWPWTRPPDKGDAPRGAGARGLALGVLWLLLLVVAASYTALAIPSRIHDRFEGSTSKGLDGSTFMNRATYHDERGAIELRWDAEAIRWLKDHVAGSPVVLEASAPIYRWGSRISVHTGLPTVLGWDWHQRQQRAILKHDPVARRQREIAGIYEAVDKSDVLPLLEEHRVRYVVVGRLERLYHPGPGLDAFSAGAPFREVYRNPQVVIYEVEPMTRRSTTSNATSE